MARRTEGHAVKAVRVDWIDSMAQHGWGHYDPEVEMACTSVGILVESRGDRVVLALSRSAYQHGDYLSIPRSAVRRVKRLR